MSPTMIRAKEVQCSLGPEFDSFVKLMYRSHVASAFTGIPISFSRLYLPCKDSAFILENESGEQYELKYSAEYSGLGTGWKKFALEHKLLEGDVLVFHLVGPTKFKVYITRANDLTNSNLDAPTKLNDAGEKCLNYYLGGESGGLKASAQR